MNKNQKIFNIVGAVAIVLCILAVVFTKYHNEIFNSKYVSGTEKSDAVGSFTMDSDEIVYDGRGELNLMQGVSADDGKGNNVTDKVSALVTAEGTMGRKIVKYSFEDASGKTVSKKRTLVLQNYKGPSLEVSNSIKVNSKSLKNLISVLKETGKLSADDGYNKDITSSVTCVREKLYSSTYRVTFSVTNVYGDSVSKSVDMFITGQISDPEIKLSKESITLRKGTKFEPKSLVAYAFDGNTEGFKNLEIDANINPERAGTYSVIYKMYNANRTAVATKKLMVIVEE